MNIFIILHICIYIFDKTYLHTYVYLQWHMYLCKSFWCMHGCRCILQARIWCIYFRFHHFTEWSTVFVLWGLLLEFVAVSHPSKKQFACQEGTARSELEAQKADILVLQTPWILLPKTNRNSHLKIGRNYRKTKRLSSNRIYFQVQTCCDFQGWYPPSGFNSYHFLLFFVMDRSWAIFFLPLVGRRISYCSRRIFDFLDAKAALEEAATRSHT